MIENNEVKQGRVESSSGYEKSAIQSEDAFVYKNLQLPKMRISSRRKREREGERLRQKECERERGDIEEREIEREGN